MSRIVLWWIAFAATVVLVAIAFGIQSGTCVDSAYIAASSCTTQRSGVLLLIGLIAFVLSAWKLTRAYREGRS